MPFYPPNCLHHAPRPVQLAWGAMEATAAQAKMNPDGFLLAWVAPQPTPPYIDAQGRWVTNAYVPEEWLIGSVDGASLDTVVYRPAFGEWRLRNPRTGEDRIVSLDRAMHALEAHGLF